MKFQFTLRSLLAMVLFLAILLSLLRTGASADGLQKLHLLLGYWGLFQPIAEDQDDSLGLVPEESPTMGLR
jgi:hypothetical protein